MLFFEQQALLKCKKYPLKLRLEGFFLANQ